MFQTPPRKKADTDILVSCLEETTPLPQQVERVSGPKGSWFPDNAVCSVIENVLTAPECEAIIQLAEKEGFEPALLNVGGGRQIYAPDTRNSKRAIIDDKRFSECIFKRIQHLLPTSNHVGFQAVGINERVRILRYEPGDEFKPHCDGSYARPDGSQVSLWTVMIYLNHGFEGGSTLFHSTEHVADDDDTAVVAIVPKSGSVLLFDHSLYHEGQKVLQGTKYAIRTDMMFQKSMPTLEERMDELND